LRIRQGLKNHEFSDSIQPTVNIETGTTWGYESLIRWDDDGTLRSPAVFLNRFREVIKDATLYEQVVDMRRRLTDRAASNDIGFLTFDIGLENLQSLRDAG